MLRRRWVLAHRATVLGVLTLFGLVLITSAGEIAGVSLPDTMRIGGQDLVLNGMGMRKRAILKVYVAGLYLSERQSDPDAILESNRPYRSILVFRSAVSAERMCGMWKESLLASIPDPAVEVDANFGRLCRYMEDFDKGDELSITYLPGRGSTVHIDRRFKGRIPGKDFADALLACFIGSAPPSEELKQGLLGVASDSGG